MYTRCIGGVGMCCTDRYAHDSRPMFGLCQHPVAVCDRYHVTAKLPTHARAITARRDGTKGLQIDETSYRSARVLPACTHSLSRLLSTYTGTGPPGQKQDSGHLLHKASIYGEALCHSCPHQASVCLSWRFRMYRRLFHVLLGSCCQECCSGQLRMAVPR